MSKVEIYTLKFLIDPTQVTLEQLKEKTENVLSDYLPDKIKLNVDGANAAFLQLEVKGSLESIDKCHKIINKKLVTKYKSKFVRVVDEAGDEIRRRAYPILADIEQRFRVFINRGLIEVIGFDWWDSLAPSTISEKIESRFKDEIAKGLLHPIECTDFDHLITLITAEVSQWSDTKSLSFKEVEDLVLNCETIEVLKDKFKEKVKKFSYWDVFEPYFKDRDQWEEVKKTIKVVINERNKVMHHRQINYGVLKNLSKIKVQLIKLFDSTKQTLSEQEREEARDFVNKYAKSWKSTLENLKFAPNLSAFGTITQQMQSLQSPSVALTGLSAFGAITQQMQSLQPPSVALTGLSAIEAITQQIQSLQPPSVALTGLSAIEAINGKMQSVLQANPTLLGSSAIGAIPQQMQSLQPPSVALTGLSAIEAITQQMQPLQPLKLPLSSLPIFDAITKRMQSL